MTALLASPQCQANDTQRPKGQRIAAKTAPQAMPAMPVYGEREDAMAFATALDEQEKW